MLGSTFRRFLPGTYRKYVDFDRRRQIARIDDLLRNSTLCERPVDEEDIFRRLQNRPFPKAAAYKHDKFSAYRRAAERLVDVDRRLPCLQSPSKILEVSCGDGVFGHLLSVAGHSVALTDIEDWRESGAGNLPFSLGNVCGELPYESGAFDVVLSYNATEHWPDPAAALAEIARILAPGGFVYLNFGPLFNSPWGLHAWSFNFPYPQFILSEEFIQSKVRQIEVFDLARTSSLLQPTNKWPLSRYRELWRQSSLQVEYLFEDMDFRYLDLIEELSPSFLGKNLSFDELTRNSIEIVLRKMPVDRKLGASLLNIDGSI